MASGILGTKSSCSQPRKHAIYCIFRKHRIYRIFAFTGPKTPQTPHSNALRRHCLALEIAAQAPLGAQKPAQALLGTLLGARKHCTGAAGRSKALCSRNRCAGVPGRSKPLPMYRWALKNAVRVLGALKRCVGSAVQPLLCTTEPLGVQWDSSQWLVEVTVRS